MSMRRFNPLFQASLLSLSFGAVCVLCATLAGYGSSIDAPKLSWALDLFSHFRLQYLGLAFIGTLITLGLLGYSSWKQNIPQKRWLIATLLIWVLSLSFNAVTIVPYYTPTSPSPPSENMKIQSFQVFHLNVYGHNRNSTAVHQAIAQANPRESRTTSKSAKLKTPPLFP